jgi:hypothetical protein
VGCPKNSELHYIENALKMPGFTLHYKGMKNPRSRSKYEAERVSVLTNKEKWNRAKREAGKRLEEQDKPRLVRREDARKVDYHCRNRIHFSCREGVRSLIPDYFESGIIAIDNSSLYRIP